MARVRKAAARSAAASLLKKHGITTYPVPVQQIAEAEGVGVYVDEGLEDAGVSGYLARDGGESIIVLNPRQPEVRQRFSLAHEMGHYLMHPVGSYRLSRDESSEVLFRNGASSTGSVPEEIEANQFAAELLMPREFILAALSRYSKDVDPVGSLAKAFDVSERAMRIRLSVLGYLNPLWD